MIWKLQYSSQQFLSASPRSRSLPAPSDKSSTSCSPSPPCQVRLAWLWTPCLHILLNTLLVDAGFLHNAWRWVHALEMWALDRGARGGWEENIKSLRGAGPCVFLSVWVKAYRSRCCLALSSWRLQRKIYECSHGFSLKDKSSVSALILAVSDCFLFSSLSRCIWYCFFKYSLNLYSVLTVCGIWPPWESWFNFTSVFQSCH